MNKPLVLFTAPIATRSGYGSHARDILQSLIKTDKYDIKVSSINWGDCPMNALNPNNPKDKLIIDRILTDNSLERQPDIHMQVTVPNEFQPIGKYNIGITAGIETTAVSNSWIDGCNKMNLVIVT